MYFLKSESMGQAQEAVWKRFATRYAEKEGYFVYQVFVVEEVEELHQRAVSTHLNSLSVSAQSFLGIRHNERKQKSNGNYCL
jgi:hypothetical protein